MAPTKILSRYDYSPRATNLTKRDEMSSATIARNVFIMGSSGFAREIKTYVVEATHSPEENIFFVDDSSKDALSVAQYHQKVNGDSAAVTILGSGRPEVKARMLTQVRTKFFKLIHPSAMVSPTATVDLGTVVAPGAVVSVNTIVGEHVLLNYNCTIGHDSIVGSLAVISPNASIGGWVTVGEGAYVGSGAQIKEKLTVGNGSVVGMGAVVTKDIPAGHIAIGVPARIYTPDEWAAHQNL